jgi:hypothetical protein
MKIKVIRDYSGAEGEGPDKNVLAGSTHSVTHARGLALEANGLVKVVSHEAHPDDEKEKAVDGEKSIKPIANKAAPVAPNKAAAKPRDKTKGQGK